MSKKIVILLILALSTTTSLVLAETSIQQIQSPIYTEEIGAGFSFGQMWEQELSQYAQMENTTAFFVRYDSPKWFSFTTSVRQATNQDIGTQYNLFRMAPEFHITDKLTLKDSFTNYMAQTRYKNEVTLVYTPALKKYAESLKFELGVAQTYYQGGRQRNQIQFSTGFKL